ncbi:MAG: hypothetical protein AB7F35_08960 [Acetobacteraceae bacterium]
MRIGSGFFATIVLVAGVAVSGPGLAQQFGNPFGARGGGGLGPYGTDAGASAHLMQLPASPRLIAQARPGAAAIAAVPEEKSADLVHQGEGESTILQQMFVGCTVGAFLGGFSVITAAEAAAPAVAAAGATAVAGAAAAAAPAVVSTLASAAGIGCGLGASTAIVASGAGAMWQWVAR